MGSSPCWRLYAQRVSNGTLRANQARPIPFSSLARGSYINTRGKMAPRRSSQAMSHVLTTRAAGDNASLGGLADTVNTMHTTLFARSCCGRMDTLAGWVFEFLMRRRVQRRLWTTRPVTRSRGIPRDVTSRSSPSPTELTPGPPACSTPVAGRLQLTTYRWLYGVDRHGRAMR